MCFCWWEVFSVRLSRFERLTDAAHGGSLSPSMCQYRMAIERGWKSVNDRAQIRIWEGDCYSAGLTPFVCTHPAQVTLNCVQVPAEIHWLFIGCACCLLVPPPTVGRSTSTTLATPQVGRTKHQLLYLILNLVSRVKRPYDNTTAGGYWTGAGHGMIPLDDAGQE